MSEIPTPAARVTAIFEDGPYERETLQLPWARLELRLPVWDGDEPRDVVYRLAAPWRGQDTARYRLVESERKAA